MKLIAALLLSLALLTGCDQSTNTYNCSDDTPCDDSGNALSYAPYWNPVQHIWIQPGMAGYVPVYVGHPFGWGPRRQYRPSPHYHQTIVNQNTIHNTTVQQRPRPSQPRPTSRPRTGQR